MSKRKLYLTCMIIGVMVMSAISVPANSFAESAPTETVKQTQNVKENEIKDPDVSSEKNEKEPSETKAQTQSKSGQKRDADNDWNYKIDLKWEENDTAQQYHKLDVTTEQSKLNPKYALTISTNAVTYEKDQFEVRIPREIWKNRGKSGVLPSSIGVPKKPATSSDHDFYYYIDGSDLVFANCRELKPGTNAKIQVMYTIDPANTLDLSKAAFQATAKATATSQDEAELQESREITYSLDTGVKVTNVIKKALGPMYYWNADYVDLENSKPIPKPDDFDDNNYVAYKVESLVKGNQPCTFKYQEKPGSGGKVVSVRVQNITSNTYTRGNTTVDYDNGTWSTDFAPTSNPGSMRAYYTVVVAYPKGEPIDVYTNDIDFEVVAKDNNYNADNPEGAEDQNDKDTGSANTKTTWQDYQFSYSGNVFDVEKDYMSGTSGAIDQLKSGVDSKANFTIRATTQGYDLGQTYQMNLIDDVLYWNIDGTKPVRMTADDFEFSSIAGYISNSLTDRKTGEITYPSSYDGPAVFYGKKSDDGQWEKIKEITIGNNGSNASNNFERIDLANEGYTSIKISTPTGMQDLTKIAATVYIRIKHDSPTLQKWLKEEPNLDKISLTNFDGHMTYGDKDGKWLNPVSEDNYLEGAKTVGLIEHDQGLYKNLLHRETASADLGGYVRSSNAVKTTGKSINDVVNRKINTDFAISGYHGIGSDSSQIASLKDMIDRGFQPDVDDEAVLYDLLPMGFYYNADEPVEVIGASNKETSGYARSVEAEVTDIKTIDNYKGTGRQMVKFYVKSKGDPGENWSYGFMTLNKGTSLGYDMTARYMQGVFTGFSLSFNASVDWEDLSLARTGTNFMAYQRADGAEIATAKADNGTSNLFINKVKGEDGQSVFYDLNEDGDAVTKNTLYSTSPVTINAATALQVGIDKKVKANRPAESYSDYTKADLGGTYSYRVYMGNSESGKLDDVILYDILEEAANTEGNTGETGWKGTFKNIDLSRLEVMGIAPTVYYATEEGLSYNNAEDMKLNSGNWTTMEPKDKSKITAIAVDCSKAKGGGPFTFEPAASASVVITMDAPDKLPEAKFAYNRPAYYSKFTPTELEGAIAEEMNVGDRVTVLLNEAFGKKTYGQDTPSGENGSSVKAGDKIKYEISYGNDLKKPQEVVITDKLDEGLTIEDPSKDISGGGIYDEENHTITWTLKDVESGAYGTVSFTAKVNKQATKKVKNKATVQVGSEPEITTNQLENPVQTEPVKTYAKNSEAGKDGAPVVAGDKVTYEIQYENYLDSQQDIVITDKLDEGLNYVSGSASDGGTYDEESRTITWTLKDIPAGEKGSVHFTAEVNSGAKKKIENQADVKVGKEPNLTTNELENPIPAKTYAENSEKGKGGDFLEVGDKVTYEISYGNSSGETQDIVITDKLDEGLYYYPDSVSDGGIYDGDSHTITWILKGVESGTYGKVSFTAKVNKHALRLVENKAVVKVGNSNEVTTNILKNPLVTEVILEGEKSLTGAALKDEQFEFEVRDKDGNLVATGKNDAAGKITFTGITFKKAGVYQFTIQEVKGEEAGIIYDDAAKEVQVTISKNEDGSLETAVSYPQGGARFLNKFDESLIDDSDSKEDPTETGETTKPSESKETDSKRESTNSEGKGTKGNETATGDDSNTMLYVLLAAIAIAVIGSTLCLEIRRRRKVQG